jgi:uncharacterized protein (TIGR02145 family)
MKKLITLILGITLVYSCSTSSDGNGNSTTTVVPIAPSSLTGTVASTTQINLSWTDNSTNEIGFKIERKTGTENYAVVGTTTADITTFNNSGLSPNTTYKYRVYSNNAVGNSLTYSNELTLTTINTIIIPTLITTVASSISNTTAISGGTISSDGGATITARGIVWGTSSSPTTILPTKTSDGTGIGSFTSAISGLTSNITYYIRAYATNSVGTAYGNEYSFTTTASILPTITTTALSSITTTTAVSGGSISSDGGALITAKGVCWSTGSSPSIALSTKTINGGGTGTFSSTISGLLTNSTYYIRAYATNSVGTAYGNQYSLTTAINVPGPNVTDIDGNVYQSVSNCNQTWTKTNLNVSKYRDGYIIPQITNQTDWNNLTTGAWCYYDNDPVNGAIYGKLYNWYAVAGIYDAASLANPSLRKQFSPSGWHVPSQTEFLNLSICFGGNTISGDKVKEAGTTHWANPTGATNISGFTALPGGFRSGQGGVYNIINFGGRWWCSEESAPTHALFVNLSTLHLVNNTSYFSPGTGEVSHKGYGYSVRLVKD